MQSLLTQIDRLAREELPAIGLELTAAIKAAQIHLEVPAAQGGPSAKDDAWRPAPAAIVRKSLLAAGKQQDAVIQSLERIRDELARWDRFRGFYRDVGQLWREQEESGRRCGELSQRTLGKD